jgi:hypothetical protein
MRVHRAARVAGDFLEPEHHWDAREAKQTEQPEVVHERPQARLLEDFAVEQLAGLRRRRDGVVGVRGEGGFPAAAQGIPWTTFP